MTVAHEPRRKFLRWLGNGALGSLVAVATVFRPSAAEAHNLHYACCHLVLPPSSDCVSRCSDISGFNIRAWTCCANGYLYVCQECTTGASCWGEDEWYECSRYYRTQNRCY